MDGFYLLCIVAWKESTEQLYLILGWENEAEIWKCWGIIIFPHCAKYLIKYLNIFLKYTSDRSLGFSVAKAGSKWLG